MPTFDTFPDVEAMIGTRLRNVGGVIPARVYSSVPNNPSFPLITVKRIGGVPRERHRLDRANIQVDVWGTSKSEAFDIATAARTALHQMEGTTISGTGFSGYVTGVEDTLGMTWLPDPETHRDRYTFGVAVYAHA